MPQDRVFQISSDSGSHFPLNFHFPLGILHILLDPCPRISPSTGQSYPPQFPCSTPPAPHYQINEQFLLEMRLKGEKAYI